ncbi:hypothetical protein M404DRAFT_999330 [Pisolithus tinctorius Marx 270]|uniref:Protein-S-isoprenylcysteine O-methyltransferase n=1 Tax=Pisolithus tinctorius Marx 270 TaxID=870435 RepID=A0A0C3JAK6_PISTI|nr:hypothetical protein M404DRAFT_999330 [Pisolithus tinctorius Marx 270]
MSVFLRPALILVQAVFNQAAYTPPNKTQEKFRYHTEEPLLLQIAPLIFKLHTIALWWIAAFELVAALNHHVGTSLSPSLSTYLDAALFPASRFQNLITPIFVAGTLLLAIGSCIRVRCFNELGQLFTFDLTMHPEHKLVTSGPYAYVRHPSYLGSILVVIGFTFSHLTSGSLLVECLLGHVGSALVWAVWWIWTAAVAKSRVLAEDNELQKKFGSEWDAYAANVKCRFVPGLL